METISEALSNKLNSLLTTLYDGEKGYQEAADNVNNETLKSRFTTLSKQRYDFGHEIKEIMTRFGVKPDKGTSTIADIHRFWMSLRTAISNQDEEVILNECVRGESSAVETYEDILSDLNLHGEIKQILENQLVKIRQAKKEMNELKEAFAIA